LFAAASFFSVIDFAPLALQLAALLSTPIVDPSMQSPGGVLSKAQNYLEVRRISCTTPKAVPKSPRGNSHGGNMERSREQLTLPRRGRNGNDPQFSEPLERRGAWNGPSARAAARSYWHRATPSAFANGNADQLARGLGWFSIGLGLTIVLAPRAFEKFLGITHQRSLLRLIGLREIASGVGILTQRRPAGWLWARVGGDVMDIAGLGVAATADTAKPGNIAVAAATVAGVTALDVRCARELSSNDGAVTGSRTVWVKKSIQINRSPQEIYAFWRDFQNLPRFMSNLESVQSIGDGRSHWVAIAPAGKRIEWDAEIVGEQENSLITWRSLEGADVENAGSVRFEAAPRGRGTFVKVQIQYRPRGGLLGATVAKLLGRAPEQQVHEDLHHLKQLLEAGEIITTEGQPAGRASSTSWRYDRTIRRQVSPAAAYQETGD
jgi:uncharacterized membrane protein